MVKVYLSLGSNLGNRLGNISNAIDSIRKLENSRFLKNSRFYDTEPFGRTDQPRFLNCVVELETLMEPRELLMSLKKIEKDMGRAESLKWSQRLIDIDILTFGSLRIETDDLIIPHPKILQREFVLKPMCDLDERYIVCGQSKTVREALEELEI